MKIINLLLLIALAVLLLRRPQLTSNDETWTWTDYQGRERTLTVSRNVH